MLGVKKFSGLRRFYVISGGGGLQYFTQSSLSPGNCWQTAIACLLEVDPELLPPQHEIEAIPNAGGVLGGWGSYSNVLNGYLGKHHGLIYSEIQAYQFGSVRPIMPGHTMCGPTVRTETLKKNGSYHIHHCVVGVEGKAVWDVHPSRQGLIEVKSWGILGELQPVSLADRKRFAKDPAADLVFNQCLCPKCNLDKLREMVRMNMTQGDK